MTFRAFKGKWEECIFVSTKVSNINLVEILNYFTEWSANFSEWSVFDNSGYHLLNPSSANPTKWSKTLKQFLASLPTNCLSLFAHFVGLVLKRLKANIKVCSPCPILLDYLFASFFDKDCSCSITLPNPITHLETNLFTGCTLWNFWLLLRELGSSISYLWKIFRKSKISYHQNIT